jgi:uncharacterized RDD family membrane protein YckC
MEEKYPELKERFQSTLIDTLIIITLMFVVSSFLDHFDSVPEWLNVVLFIGLFIAYEPLCMTFGATPGNYWKRIRVRKYSDTKKRINFFQAILRYPIKVLLGWISFLTIHSNPKRRAIHDLVSGTVMIQL